MVIGVSGPNFCKIFSIPDNEEILDPSLNIIKYNLNPVYNSTLI